MKSFPFFQKLDDYGIISGRNGGNITYELCVIAVGMLFIS